MEVAILISIIIISLLVYGLFIYIKWKRKFKSQQNAMIAELLIETGKFHKETAELTSQYVDQSRTIQIKEDYEMLYLKVEKLTKELIASNPSIASFKSIYSDIFNWKKEKNQNFLTAEAYAMNGRGLNHIVYENSMNRLSSFERTILLI
ncbi:hypothetical protein [Viridibacillus arvi]|uniref:Uncharacterized protein n=1 Tax=Viridibacillus arvi TaxID=263475 RepID=A0A0M0LLQ0_9BACL|nr:hypothetical protein [Viridibacillus arvi]KOO51842.1 hypothetical protein AMD00_05250 [Viridibacillus arvi]